jgi:uncharacterized membrane protein YphA (DoxX/SURF4 family)
MNEEEQTAPSGPKEAPSPNDPPEKASAASRARKWLKLSYGTPVLVFVLMRINDAAFFLWGSINKAPWNDFGCHNMPGESGYSWLAPGDCTVDILRAEAANMPFGAGNIITMHVLPNLLPFEWFTFILETTLAITLGLGLLTRLFSLVATVWATFIIAQYAWIPDMAFPDSALFILAPLFIVTISGGTALTLDSKLRPWLERHPNPVSRFLAKCMF